MAAVVATTGHNFIDVNSTTHGVVLPSGISSGDLLIVLVASDGSTTWSGWPSGWVQLFNNAGQPSNQFQVRYKIADGSETDFTLTSTANEKSELYSLRITGWHGTTPPESADDIGDASNADPPNLNISWGAEDNLLIVACCLNASGDITAFPTDYSSNQFEHANTGAGGVTIGLATRTASVSSENPGAFANAAQDWVACTIAVRPTGAAEIISSWDDYVVKPTEQLKDVCPF